MVSVFKTIKPQRLKDKEMKEALRHATERAGRQIVKDLEQTTETWEHKPTFKMSTTVTGKKPEDNLAVRVYTGNEPRLDPPDAGDIWNMLDNGTRPHEIWAGAYTGKSDKKVLAFPSMFSPKTTPNALSSKAGASGGETIFRAYVEHPGTEARNWTKVETERRRAWFKEQMVDAMKEAAQASGHKLK
jgi:hypothetical protein